MKVRRIKPGDPGFDEIAKTIRPIERVRRESHPHTYIDADQACSSIGQRRESVDKFRG
jgi:hypothetical protein